MNPSSRPHPLLSARAIAQMPEQIFIHPLNPKAIRHTKSLGTAIGFDHLGVHLIRLAPGDDSTQHHTHQIEEEFIYIISGQGLALIGDDCYEVGPGDFMGFVAGSLPHSLSNPFDVDLVYLVGGLNLEYDICDYPKLGQRMYRIGETRNYISLESRSSSDLTEPLTAPEIDSDMMKGESGDDI